MDFGLVYLVLKIASNNCACDFPTRFCSNILSNWRRIALHLSTRANMRKKQNCWQMLFSDVDVRKGFIRCRTISAGPNGSFYSFWG